MLKINQRLIGFRLLLFSLFALFVSNVYAQNTIFTSQLPASFGNDGDYELGTKFTSAKYSEITAIRFYKAPGETGTHTGKIWSSSGDQLASVTFTSETGSGWQTAVLAQPLRIDPAAVYIVSVNTNSFYAAAQNGLASAVSNGFLSTVADNNNGVFNVTPGSFPTQSYNNSNYFVDVTATELNSIFTTQTPAEEELTDGPNIHYEMGVKFRSTEAGKVKYIKYYKSPSDNGLHTGHLWNADRAIISSVVFENETSSGWQYAKLTTPINISASTDYVVSVNSNVYYAATKKALGTSVSGTNGILSTVQETDGKNGYYSEILNGQVTFPTNYYENANYFRDIVVEPIYHPAVPAITFPANNANGISIEPVLTWASVSGATSYSLQVATDEAFTHKILDISNITAAAYTVTGLLNEHQYYWKVKAVNELFESVYSAASSFTTIKHFDVLLSWPTGGVSLYVKNPVISWYVPLGGTGWKFDLLYSTNSDMTSSTVISNLSTNTYTLSGLQPGTDYYWQIRLKTATGAVVGYSAKEKFVSFGKALVPVASWPIGNPTVYTLSPTLYWYLNDASTDLTYELELREGAPSALTGTATIQNISTSFVNVPALLPNTQYSWQVKSKSGSSYSTWSTPASFKTLEVNAVVVPIPSWPVGEATIYTTSPTLNWYLGTAAAGLTYEVEWVNGRMSSFTGNPQITNISSLSTTLSGPEPGNYIKWRVRSVLDATHKSEWSDVAAFIVNGPAVIEPPVPVASWPVGGAAVYTSSAQLNWYLGITKPVGLTFDVEYTTGTLTGTATITGITSLNTVISALQAGKTYKWSVCSVLGTAHSAWSAVQTFTTVSNAPVAAQPILSWPIGGATVYTNSPTLSWFLNSGSTGLTYELKYSTSPSMTGALTISGLTSVQYVLNNLTPGTTYYWTVRSFDGTVYSAPSVAGSFTIFAGNSAVAPIAGSPAGGVAISTGSPVLSWYIPTQGDIESYEVQYSNSSDMSQATLSTVTSTSMAIKANEGTSYFWRVRSKNSKGETSAYSDIERFVTSQATGLNEAANTVTSYSLKQNFPNPFNPSTTITYDIPKQSYVELAVYDMLGRQAAILVSREQSEGQYKVQFDGSSLPSGIYIYTLHAGEFRDSKKLMLMK